MKARALALLGLLLLGPMAQAGESPERGRELFRLSAPGRQACAGCHGRDGQGASEGDLRAPPINWRVLAQEQGYDRASFGSALASGVAADGRRLSAMPRYAFPGTDVAALASYLDRLPQDDAGGITAARITLAAIATDAADPWPSLLSAALASATGTGGIFSRQVAVLPVTLAALDDLKAGDVFIAVGLPAAHPAAASRALAQKGIPNILPRGFLAGSEPPGDSAGWLPTIAQIVSSAERLPACAAEPPIIVTADRESARELNQKLGTIGGSTCRIALVSRSDNKMPVAALLAGTQTLHFEPAPSTPGLPALEAFASMAAGRLVAALKAGGPAPTRTALLRALAEISRASAPVAPPVFR